ncbi:hypothetical protein ACFL2K_01085 [Candidatus Margulisiibacteriota bacterium]
MKKTLREMKEKTIEISKKKNKIKYEYGKMYEYQSVWETSYVYLLDPNKWLKKFPQKSFDKDTQVLVIEFYPHFRIPGKPKVMDKKLLKKEAKNVYNSMPYTKVEELLYEISSKNEKINKAKEEKVKLNKNISASKRVNKENIKDWKNGNLVSIDSGAFVGRILYFTKQDPNKVKCFIRIIENGKITRLKRRTLNNNVKREKEYKYSEGDPVWYSKDFFNKEVEIKDINPKKAKILSIVNRDALVSGLNSAKAKR